MSKRADRFLFERACYKLLVVLATAGCMASPISIFDYVNQTWGALTRSHRNMAMAAFDPKLHSANERAVVYLGAHEDLRRVEEQLRIEMRPEDLKNIDIQRLPEDLSQLKIHGLLYLPYPYVVPGGRFNEMYGWDSFFIQMGLLRDGHLDLARDMAGNVLYEVQEYGKVLNAN